jgi:Queuosine salvage protein
MTRFEIFCCCCIMSTASSSPSPAKRVISSAQWICESFAREVQVSRIGIEKTAEWVWCFFLQLATEPSAYATNYNSNNETKKLSKEYAKDGFKMQRWQENELHPSSEKELCAEWQRRPWTECELIDWVFVIDTLNFSFWSQSDVDADTLPYSVTFNGTRWQGYWSLCASIDRALVEDGVEICKSSVLAALSRQQLAHVFRGDADGASEPPMLDERLTVLREAGKVLIEHFDGSFVNVVRRANGSAARLVELVVEHFQSYRDQVQLANVDGEQSSESSRTLCFYKRAQILVADCWAALGGTSLGAFDDIDDEITMFADYRVPQALVHCGILRYSDAANERLRRGDTVLPGSRLELEIRGCSIWGIELLSRLLRQSKHARDDDDSDDGGSKHRINAITIDFFLWDYAKAHSDELEAIPIHRTRSIYY